jgi:hypothetical protein
MGCGWSRQTADSGWLAGNQHHACKALVERLAGGFIVLGRVPVILAMLAAFLAWVVTR